MFRRRLAIFNAILCGVLVGLALWGLALGAQIRRHDPGLWTLRFQRVLACGLDYNGPPYTAQVTLWLSCGETGGWRLWPLRK